jgi:hypothetical protein
VIAPLPCVCGLHVALLVFVPDATGNFHVFVYLSLPYSADTAHASAQGWTHDSADAACELPHVLAQGSGDTAHASAQGWTHDSADAACELPHVLAQGSGDTAHAFVHELAQDSGDSAAAAILVDMPCAVLACQVLLDLVVQDFGLLGLAESLPVLCRRFRLT